MAKIELKKGGAKVTGKTSKDSKYGSGSGTRTYSNQPQVLGMSTPPAARGDDFASNLNEMAKSYHTTSEDLLNEGGSVSSIVTGYSPTVMSNADKVERVVPLLDSQASILGGGGDATFTDIGSDMGGYGDSGDFGDILGLNPEKKKKKKKEESLFSAGEVEVEEDPYFTQQMSLLDKMARSQDKATRAYISSLQDTFNQRRSEQEQSNAQQLAGVKQALNLGGSSRYAPVSSSGIISMKEAQGIRALSDLDSQEQQLIAEAKQAQVDRDYQLLEQKLGLLENVRKEKSAAASALQEETRMADFQSSRDNAIAGLVSQGITDPVEMLNYLNFDEAGNRIGDFTLGEITGALSSLNELRGKGIGGTGFTLDNKAIGQMLGSGLTTTDIANMQADLNAGASLEDILSGYEDPEEASAVRRAFGVDESQLRPNETIDELVRRNRVFSKIAPMMNKGSLSDADAVRINDFITEAFANGLTEQQILDEMAGMPTEINTPYNALFRDAIVANSDTMEKQTQNMTRLSQQLSSGNFMAAMNTVEKLPMS